MKIACVLDNWFEDSEFQKPYDAFIAAGHQVDIVGTEAGKELKGKKGTVTTRSDRAFGEVRPADYDALLIPGGDSPDHLRAHPEPVAFVTHFFETGKPIFAICHGPQLFLTADTYRGYRMTAWKTVQGDLQKAGADVVDEEVVVDRNLVTSRMPADIPAFIRESEKLLESGVGATG
ncbi:MAG TPA: type 1 glutamine amidotransferase domain-containing protein [Candidatus Dormibacteraeota bacterium]